MSANKENPPFKGVDLSLLGNITRERVPEFTGNWLGSPVICYYCVNCEILNRNPIYYNKCKHSISVIKMERITYNRLTHILADNFLVDTSHGTGWKITKEELEEVLFEIYL